METELPVCGLEPIGYELISEICNATGADLFPLDMSITAPYYHDTALRYPFCKPQSCLADNIDPFL